MPILRFGETEPLMATAYGRVAAILVCGAFGYLLDGWLDTKPLLSLLGLVSAVEVGFYQSTLRSRRIQTVA
jgi:F0F1-type ATP synthase assembly protein I